MPESLSYYLVCRNKVALSFFKIRSSIEVNTEAMNAVNALCMVLLTFCSLTTAATPAAVIASMDPVRLNETVVSVVPGYLVTYPKPLSSTIIQLCSGVEGGSSCRTVQPLNEAVGVVHWVLPADMPGLGEYKYRLCPLSPPSSPRLVPPFSSTEGGMGTESYIDQCNSSFTKLNAAQVWWHQCVGTSTSPASRHGADQYTEPVPPGNVIPIPVWANGLECTAGISMLRLFGKGFAYDSFESDGDNVASAAGSGSTGKCAPYTPYNLHRPPNVPKITLARAKGERAAKLVANVDADSAPSPTQIRLTPTSARGRVSAPPPPTSTAEGATILAAAAQSCYDASFKLPSSLQGGTYTVELKSNLPNATWMLPADPDQHTVTIYKEMAGIVAQHHAQPHTNAAAASMPNSAPTLASTLENCYANKNDDKVYSAGDRPSLLAALATAKTNGGGGTIKLAHGVIEMEASDMLIVPDCTVAQRLKARGCQAAF